MNIVMATIYLIVLEFTTIFAWFAVVVYIKDIINLMVSAVDMAQVTTVGQNVVTGLNVTFLVLVFIWFGWYAYVVHSLTYETSFTQVPPRQVRRW
jgi:ABC-type dipeptide/oligopeptide/nickel transport system permease subunit